MHVVLTAGHSDHGKSALIRAITGAGPARWAAARRHGAAADVGFGWMTLPCGEQMSFVDVPWHDRYATTMLASAGPAGAVLFVVAADQGWKPQSSDQLAVVDALGVRRGVLAVTKSDLADPAPVLAEATEQIARTSLGSLPAVALSSVTGAGIPELLAALDELARSLPKADPGAPVRIWVDRAIATGVPVAAGGSAGGDAAAGPVVAGPVVADTVVVGTLPAGPVVAGTLPAGTVVAGTLPAGTVVAGTLPAGTVHRGDELLVSPAMRPVRVGHIQTLGESADSATGTTRVALSLPGVGRDAVRRGMALVQAGRWTLTDVIDVRIRSAGTHWAAGPGSEVAAGHQGRTVIVHIGAARVLARVRPLGPGLARLTLADPLPLHVGDELLLRESAARRDQSQPAVAGAVVLDVAAPPLSRRGAATAATRQLASWPDRPTAADLLARHGLLRASTLLAMGVSEHPRPVAGEWLADTGRWRALGHRLGEVLASHAAADPLAAGLPVEVARAALDLPDTRLVTALAKPPFQLSCGLLRIVRPASAGSEPGPQLPEAVQAAVRVLRADLAAAPFVSPDADRLRKLGLDASGIAAAVRAGLLIRISDHVVLAPGAEIAAATVLARLEQPFTAAQARQALDTTRRTAIPLLEYLDSAGITQRLADDRRLLLAVPGHPAAAVPGQAGGGGQTSSTVTSTSMSAASAGRTG